MTLLCSHFALFNDQLGWRSHGLSHIFTPRACARGKVCMCAVVVGTKIASSRDLGICACCKHESVDICEKRVSVRFELLNMAHERYKSCIFRSACLWFTDRTHSAPCARAHSARAHNCNSGKQVKVIRGLLLYDTTAAARAGQIQIALYSCLLNACVCH